MSWAHKIVVAVGDVHTVNSGGRLRGRPTDDSSERNTHATDGRKEHLRTAVSSFNRKEAVAITLVRSAGFLYASGSTMASSWRAKSLDSPSSEVKWKDWGSPLPPTSAAVLGSFGGGGGKKAVSEEVKRGLREAVRMLDEAFLGRSETKKAY